MLCLGVAQAGVMIGDDWCMGAKLESGVMM